MNDRKRWEPDDRCHWIEDQDGIWNTTCDALFEFTNDRPKENGFMWCPFCGKPLVQIPIDYLNLRD